MADTTGEADLRKETVSRIVTGFALQEYVMKQLVMINSSNANQESYYQEAKSELTAGTGSDATDIPRGAGFPYGEVEWTKKSSYYKKHGMEGVIFWEDAVTNNIDVIARTLLRISRAVVKTVDTEIWDALTENQTPVLINTLAIPGGEEWDSAIVANRDPIQNILDALGTIEVDNYNPHGGNGFLVLNSKDKNNLLGNANVRNAGQFYTSDVTKNGQIGKLLGLTVIWSNSVTADKAAIIIAKECGTWKATKPLTVVTIEDPGIKFTIRAWEIGATQLTNPEAVCLITNTAA